MQRVYEAESEEGQLNYRGVWLQLRSKLYFNVCQALALTDEDDHIIEYLRCGFPVGYEGPILTPMANNHASILQHPCDVASYVTTEL